MLPLLTFGRQLRPFIGIDGRVIRCEAVKQDDWRFLVYYNVGMFGRDESFCRGMHDKRQQRREIPRYIEQSNRFSMQAELRPGDNLEKLVEGAVAAG